MSFKNIEKLARAIDLNEFDQSDGIRTLNMKVNEKRSSVNSSHNFLQTKATTQPLETYCTTLHHEQQHLGTTR